MFAQNEATIFYFLGLSYFYYKRFILQIKSKSIYIVLIGALLLGTKGMYLFLALLLLFHFFNRSRLKTQLATISILIPIFYFITWLLATPQVKGTLAYFAHKWNTEGVWYTLFSGRTLYLSEMNDKIMQYWTPLNYFVGGQDQSKFMIEMDLFDLFLFMGAIGFIIYFILFFASIFRTRLNKPFNFFFFFCYMTLAFLGGHFFSSVLNALYLCVISMYFYQTQRGPIVTPHLKDSQRDLYKS
jgi:hypothetical protein